MLDADCGCCTCACTCCCFRYCCYCYSVETMMYFWRWSSSISYNSSIWYPLLLLLLLLLLMLLFHPCHDLEWSQSSKNEISSSGYKRERKEERQPTTNTDAWTGATHTTHDIRRTMHTRHRTPEHEYEHQREYEHDTWHMTHAAWRMNMKHENKYQHVRMIAVQFGHTCFNCTCVLLVCSRVGIPLLLLYVCCCRCVVAMVSMMLSMFVCTCCNAVSVPNTM